MLGRVLLEINSLSKRYCRDPRRAANYALRDIWNDIRRAQDRDYLRPGEFWAVRDVSMEVRAGEVVGLIGHNGAGKSTLINLAASVLRPTLGSVALHTDRVVLMDHQGGLSPVQTGRENIGNQLSLYGMAEATIREVLDDVIDYSELGDFIDAPVGTYSLGMKVRLAFAIYSRLKPDIFIVDEALNGGDLRFRNKFLRFLTDYIGDGGSILVASHDLFAVQSLCHRCVLMEQGRVHTAGDVQEVIRAYSALALERDRALLQGGLAAVTALSEETPSESTVVAEVVSAPHREESADIIPPSASTEIVQITEVEVSHPMGGALYPGEPAQIRIVCHSPEAMEKIICSFEIGTGVLFPIATVSSDWHAPYRLQAGRNEFVCRIPALPLASGAYQMRLYVTVRDSAVVLGRKGRLDPPVLFEVDQRADRHANMAAYRKNIVHISAEWEHPSVFISRV